MHESEATEDEARGRRRSHCLPNGWDAGVLLAAPGPMHVPGRAELQRVGTRLDAAGIA